MAYSSTQAYVVSPAVAAPAPPVSRLELCRRLDLPAGARLLVGVGPFASHKGFRDAVWALDILKYLYDDLFLVLIGDGPERNRLEDFARAVRVIDRVRFVGLQPDVSAWLAAADVVWIPSITTGGTNIALEAMAASRPVVASRTPGLAGIVVDGKTGLLFKPGDKVGLARHTHLLLENGELRDRFGEAGRRRIIDHFNVTDMVRRYGDAYEKLAA
jgi:glycosyltransferase involved in cell wall biosynthesis